METPETDSLGMPIPADVLGSDAPITGEAPAAPVTDAAPADPPKRKRGRPPGSKNKPAGETQAPPARTIIRPGVPAPPPGPTPEEIAAVALQKKAEACSGLVQGAFAIVASKRGEHWKLSDEEAALIGEPLSQLLPAFDDPWMKLALASFIVLGPRIAAEANIQAEKRANMAKNMRPPRSDAMGE